MKGEINDGGELSIQRGSEFKTQICMHDTSSECGDWCPCFGEPLLSDGKHYEDGKPRVYLHICQNIILVFEELEDLRE